MPTNLLETYLKFSSRKQLLAEAETILTEIRKGLVKEDAEADFWKKIIPILDKQLMTKFTPKVQPNAQKATADLLMNLFRYDRNPIDQKTAMNVAELYVQYKSGKMTQDAFMKELLSKYRGIGEGLLKREYFDAEDVIKTMADKNKKIEYFRIEALSPSGKTVRTGWVPAEEKTIKDVTKQLEREEYKIVKIERKANIG